MKAQKEMPFTNHVTFGLIYKLPSAKLNPCEVTNEQIYNIDP